MMDGAQAEAIHDVGRARRLRISDDVSGVEEPDLFEAANGALIAVRHEYCTAEAALVQSHLRLADGVLPFRASRKRHGFRLLERADELPRRNENPPLERLVSDAEVRQLVAVLRLEHGEPGEAGDPQPLVVLHDGIVTGDGRAVKQPGRRQEVPCCYPKPTSSPYSSRSRGTCSTSRCGPSGRRTS